MATQEDIEIALNYQIVQYQTAYPIDLAFKNVSYTPTLGTSFLKIDILHGEVFTVQLGSESSDRGVGVFQITINVENDKGSAETTNLVRQLKEYFKRGTIISYNNINVRIIKFYLGSYDYGDGWFRQIINISYRSDISNND